MRVKQPYFDQTTRKRLADFVSKTRLLLTDEFNRQLQNDYGLDPNSGDVTDLARRTSRRCTSPDGPPAPRHHGALSCCRRHRNTSQGQKARQDVLDRIVREQAFTILNRLCALRMAEAGGCWSSPSPGYQSRVPLYQRLAAPHWEKPGPVTVCLSKCFDEFAVDLPVLDRFSPQGVCSRRRLLNVLQEINHGYRPALGRRRLLVDLPVFQSEG
ncbi:MAG: hypothetical protein ACLVJ6_13365 [Merdibacter sp.]